MNSIFSSWVPTNFDDSVCGVKGPSAIAFSNVISAFSFLLSGMVTAAAFLLVEYLFTFVFLKDRKITRMRAVKSVREFRTSRRATVSRAGFGSKEGWPAYY